MFAFFLVTLMVTPVSVYTWWYFRLTMFLIDIGQPHLIDSYGSPDFWDAVYSQNAIDLHRGDGRTERMVVWFLVLHLVTLCVLILSVLFRVYRKRRELRHDHLIQQGGPSGADIELSGSHHDH